jgi:hypothetical protein
LASPFIGTSSSISKVRVDHIQDHIQSDTLSQPLTLTMALAALGSLTDELITTVAKISPEQKVIHPHIMIGRSSLLIACFRTLRAFKTSSAA